MVDFNKEYPWVFTVNDSASDLEYQVPAYQCAMIEGWFCQWHDGKLDARTLMGQLHGAAIFTGKPDVMEELSFLRSVVFDAHILRLLEDEK